MDRHYRRHLPHQVPKGFPIFLTWNLKGAFSLHGVERIRNERERLRKEPSRGETLSERKVRHDKLIFALSDRFLDNAEHGPLDLKDAANAKIVEDEILSGANVRYELLAWCILANHVHVLLLPNLDLEIVTQKIKGRTAFEINGRQSQRGRVFWQSESYDHWARNEEEVYRIIAYIENNPVVADLCKLPEEWRWSSARHRKDWQIGKPFVG
jgi:putative transposase